MKAVFILLIFTISSLASEQIYKGLQSNDRKVRKVAFKQAEGLPEAKLKVLLAKLLKSKDPELLYQAKRLQEIHKAKQPCKPVVKEVLTLMDVLVVEDDTLRTLAEDFNTTVELILKANKFKADVDLIPGSVIKIPRSK